MKVHEGDTIADMNVLSGKSQTGETRKEFVLCMTSQGFGKRVATSEFRPQARGGIGLLAIKFKKSLKNEDRMSCFCIVGEDDEILLITSRGIMVRQKVSEISLQSRTATGVVVQKVDPGDHIANVGLVPKYEERDESELPVPLLSAFTKIGCSLDNPFFSKFTTVLCW